MSQTTRLMQRIAAKRVSESRISCWWLGGSGFVFKTTAGTVICIDPYLSNSVEDLFGMKRAFATPIDPEELRADAIISTHWHEDHLDPGSIPTIARNNPEAKFIMPPSATARAMSWGLRRANIVSISPGEPVALKEVVIEATPARHEAGVPGWEVPDAVGVLLQMDKLTVYHCGDTEYDVRLRRLKSRHPNVAMLCINGVSGNMDAHEAALLGWQLGAKEVIPMHHLLWATNSPKPEETLDPQLFVQTFERLGGNGHARVPRVGEEMEFTP
jgi:L-ascorbate 6-phosphate lactonase